MKTFLILFCSLFCCVLFAQAQIPVDATLKSIIKGKENIEITIQSSGEFYLGNNNFVLKVGKQNFSLYQQYTLDTGSQSRLVFFIPETFYAQFLTSDQIFLSYGRIASDIEDDKLVDYCQQIPSSCKYLGNLEKSLLIK